MEIIYQDDKIIAINKPAGISVTHDRSGRDNIIAVLQKQTGLNDLSIIHHLDKDTTGIMILAKNKEAQNYYCGLFENSKVKKTYLALVAGRPDSSSGEIDAPIAENKRDPRRMEVDTEKGKDSKTRWELLADFGSMSLLAARTQTDRTHQIRVHFSHAGFPLVIDPLYGQNGSIMLSSFKANYKLGKYEEEKPLIDRLTLCVYELEIENHHFVAPLDKKFKATIKMLTKYNSKGPAAFVKDQIFELLLSTKPLSLDI